LQIGSPVPGADFTSTRRDAFEDSETSAVLEGDHSSQLEPGPVEEGAVFIVCALNAGDVDEHFQVDMQNAQRLAMIRVDLALDNEDLSRPCHCRAAVAQDRHSLLVIPVMDDLPQDIDIAPCRYRIEEAAADYLAPILYASEDLVSASRHVQQIEQQASACGVRSQDRCKKEAASATNIHDLSDSSKVIPFDDADA
jgi:hypothetical protein